MWVEGAGHAASEPEVIRDLYGYLAASVGRGRRDHGIRSSCPRATRACSMPGSGRVSVSSTPTAIRGPRGHRRVVEPPTGILVRRAERADIPVLARLGLSLAEHQVASPVFSMIELPTLEAEVADWEDGFDDPAYATFVAEIGRDRGRCRDRLLDRGLVGAPRHRPASRTPDFSASRPCCRRRAGSVPGGRSVRRCSSGHATPDTRRSSPTGAKRTCYRAGPGRVSASDRSSGDSTARSPDRRKRARGRSFRGERGCRSGFAGGHCTRRARPPDQALAAAAARAPSQSFLNWTMPLSVSGCRTICWRTLNGSVAMCAPASAAWVM